MQNKLGYNPHQFKVGDMLEATDYGLRKGALLLVTEVYWRGDTPCYSVLNLSTGQTVPYNKVYIELSCIKVA
jgi:hypothetical protein